MLKRMLFTVVAALGTLAFTASAQAAYLSLGTTNTSNATTTLTGNTAGPELQVKNANGSTANAFGLSGGQTAISPTVNAAAVRGYNNSTNGHGYGVWGSQAGTGTGVYGSTPSGTGVWGTSGGVGVRGSSTTGIGLYGLRTSTSGTLPGVQGTTKSNALGATGVMGQNDTTIGAFTSGVTGRVNTTYNQGVLGCSNYGATESDFQLNCYINLDYPAGGIGGRFIGAATTPGSYGWGVYAEGRGSAGVGIEATGGQWAGEFKGNVHITGTITQPIAQMRIADPLDPAHKALVHYSVDAPQAMNIYNGNVVTTSKGFATVTMPRWFEALNRSFRYQLTVVGRSFARAIVWRPIRNGSFVIRTDRPHVKVSWQVAGIRHDSYANAHRTKVIIAKAGAENGKSLAPKLYGKPRSDGIGYQKPPRLPRATLKR
jgi:hypothetical protein